MSDDLLTKEQAAAWKLASLATADVATNLSKFSSWLMAGLGAALTVFLSNHESVLELFHKEHIRASLYLFAASMLFGLLAQWLTLPIKAGLAFSFDALALRKGQLEPNEFVKAFASLLIVPFKALFLYKLASATPTDDLQSIRSPARLSQYVSILILLQYLLAVSVVVALAIGLKV